MTPFRLCSRDALVLLTLVAGWSVTTAWVTPPINNNACSTTTCRPTTRLAMFDWFNPKPKTSAEEEKKSDDWMSNMFNQGSPPPKTEEKKEEVTAESAEKTTPVEEVKAVASVDDKAKIEPTVVAEETETPTKEDAKPAAAAEEELHNGVVNWFNRVRGYGFINATDGSTDADVFVHQSEIQAEGYRFLVDGEPVEYKMEHGKNGRPRALHVTGPNGGDVRITVRRKERAAAKENEANKN